MNARDNAAVRLARGVFPVLLGLLLVFWSPASFAQPTPDYSAWNALASRVEAALDTGLASDKVLEHLREQVVAFRQQFAEARNINASRIRTLLAELDALGPPPEEGEESSEIAATRTDLNKRLSDLREPGLVADAAYNRADGLIGEIDRLIRQRQAQLFLTRGPIPLNPTLWPAAGSDLVETWNALRNEVVTALNNPIQRKTLLDNILPILLLAVPGFVLLLRGRPLARAMGDYLRSIGGRGHGVWTFFTSLGRIFNPLIGVYLLTRAAMVSGVPGLRGELILNAIPIWSAVILGVAWLGERLFAPHEGHELLPYSTKGLGEARLHLSSLSILAVLHWAVELFDYTERYSDATSAVIHFPIILLAGVSLFRLMRVLKRANATIVEKEEPELQKHYSGLPRLMPPIRLVASIVSVLAPLAAAGGYLNAALDSMFPMFLTLCAMSSLLIFQDFIGRLFGYVTGRGEAAREGLIMGLVGVALTVSSLPLISLLWGVRVSELRELWSRFLQGVSVGGTRISPVEFLTFVVIFVLGYMITRLLQSALGKNILPKTNIDKGGQTAIVSGIGYLGIFLAAVIAISGAGIDLSSLAIVAGALSVGIGFGLQTIVSNFVSGIILLVERPISEGDWIEVGSHMGYVREISVRATRIETFDRSDVIVPNSDLISGSVINYTRKNTLGRVILPVGVAYGTDTKRVEAILLEVAENHPMVLARPAPSVIFQGFGASSLDFEIRAILRDVNWVMSVRSEMNHEIARRFTEEGIEIPFAQRDVWLRNPEALALAGSSQRAEESDENAGNGDPDGKGETA